MTKQTDAAEVEALAHCICAENVKRYAAYVDLVMRDCPAHPYYRAACMATFEPVASRRERAGTHTCALGAAHDGPHFCPTCRSEWEVRGIVRSLAAECHSQT